MTSEEKIDDLLHRRGDLSTFLVHLARADGAVTALDNLKNLLQTKVLQARTVMGMAGELANAHTQIAATQKVVCFTETPLEHTWMMCRKIEGRLVRLEGYGLAFTKTFARRSGANPVWYLDMTPTAGWRDFLTNSVNELQQAAVDASLSQPTPSVAELTALARQPIFKLTPFIEQMFNHPPKAPGERGRMKEFWWEREWRNVGDFPFNLADVVAVFAPVKDHAEIEAVINADTAVGRKPAVLSADWGLEGMIGKLAGVDDLGPFPQ